MDHDSRAPTRTERFADCILGVSFDRLPSEAVEIARHVVLDGIAVALVHMLQGRVECRSHS
jgi:2-methylcitrate dehydratase PrpD